MASAGLPASDREGFKSRGGREAAPVLFLARAGGDPGPPFQVSTALKDHVL